MPAPIRNAWSALRRWLAHYIYGLFAFSFNNAMTTLDGVVGLAVGAAVDQTISAPTWKTGAAIFFTTFARSAFTYFKENPLPKQLSLPDAQPPFASLDRSGNFDKVSP